MLSSMLSLIVFFTDTSTTAIYTLSLHDALPIFLAGRQLMADLGLTPQQVFLVPLIPGTDGNAKMGKSLGNTIDITLPPNDMYGKLMSMRDEVMPLYFEVLTDVPLAEIQAMRQAMEVGTVNPRDYKMRLARLVVGEFVGPGEAEAAEAEFKRVFQGRQ